MTEKQRGAGSEPLGFGDEESRDARRREFRWRKVAGHECKGQITAVSAFGFEESPKVLVVGGLVVIVIVRWRWIGVIVDQV